ncbi:GH1 family beta-glucosidase [Paenibacillus sp. 1001270B_150601_E10]|uniref:GH1 family beta-glucosidase n=1 Tax=Paenibacillus sp. 1001270B_150601_E10 TaxID=2787079 RepID=UPI00189E920A|nr:GH1 family beta-glucosidase [Paenibacillus sp. 1001270B_150601_E10]
MSINRFPNDFMWGTATAAYQIEGAYNEDGRGPSIWDTFSHTPGNVKNGDNGNVACDSYHRLDEDIRLLKELGVKTYRFSISWSRVLPTGTGAINQKGLDYYHKLVDALIEQGIEPFCTLYHWDLPQAIQDQGGWGDRRSIAAFKEYAEVMFKEFGSKIKYWITFNEPWCLAFLSNYLGIHAPGYRDLQLAIDISHHILVAHGEAVKSYRELGLSGEIGIAPNTAWGIPYTQSEEDKATCLRLNGWSGDWYLDPIYFGEYPAFMLDWYEKLGHKPPVVEGDMQTIHQPIDFIGINYYTSSMNRHNERSGMLQAEYMNMGAARTDIGWEIYPEGLYQLLRYTADKYGNPDIYITENGACYNDEAENGRVRDQRRIDYLSQHLVQASRAIADGINLKGYMAWSLMDNFEWAEGYSMRFGLVHVDFDTLVRTKKDSYYWYKHVIANNWFELR